MCVCVSGMSVENVQACKCNGQRYRHHRRRDMFHVRTCLYSYVLCAVRASSAHAHRTSADTCTHKCRTSTNHRRRRLRHCHRLSSHAFNLKKITRTKLTCATCCDMNIADNDNKNADATQSVVRPTQLIWIIIISNLHARSCTL